MGNFLRSINLLNILLAAVAFAAALYIFSPPVNKTFRISSPAVKAGPASDQKTKAEPAVSLMDYTLIADQNLFHPERKIPVDKPKAEPLPKPEFVLYGTLMTDETSLAYMDDKKAPMNTPGRGKRTRVLRKGDSLSGFVVRSIERDRVVMVRDKEVITVNLSDPKDRGAKPAATHAAPASAPAPASASAAVPVPNGVRRPPLMPPAMPPPVNR